jgi:hypothetical protein
MSGNAWVSITDKETAGHFEWICIKDYLLLEE